MNENASKLPAGGAGTGVSDESLDDATMALAEELNEQLRRRRSPEQILTDAANSLGGFIHSRGIAEDGARQWAWVLEQGLDLPTGWSTPGADPEGAALARERFAEDPSPAIVSIPDADTLLAVPIVMGADARATPVAMIAVAIAADAELDENTLTGAATSGGLAAMQIESTVHERKARRSLEFAQAASRIQRALVEPTDLARALEISVEQLERCEPIAWAAAHEIKDGARRKIAEFGDAEETVSSMGQTLDDAELDSLREAGHVVFTVSIEGREEAEVALQSRFPVDSIERDSLEGIPVAIAGTAARFRSAATIEALRRSATRRLVEAQERERSMVAADIHDGVLQQLGATAIRLELAQSRVEQRDFTTASAIIAHGATEIRSCARELRALLMELRPQVLDDNGLNAALSELGRHVEGVEVSVRSDVPEDLGSEFSITIFRIVQEALTNIQKHAHAEHANVDVAIRDGAIAIEIADDGIGYEGAVTGPSSEGSHLGLLGMRERAQMFGGSFSIAGASGGGTEINATLPLDGVPDAEL